MGNALAKPETRVAEGSLVSVADFEWTKIANNVWHIAKWENENEQYRLIGYVNYVSYDTGPNMGDFTMTYMATPWGDQFDSPDTGYFATLEGAKEWLESIVMEKLS